MTLLPLQRPLPTFLLAATLPTIGPPLRVQELLVALPHQPRYVALIDTV